MGKQGPPTLPGYEYIDVLGSGGFADVYLYEQQMPCRKVAVKVLRGEGLSDGLSRQFTAEANVMAALSSHPYIVTIFGADTTLDGRLYLAMEYYSGPNMSVRCRTKPLGVSEALRIGVQLSAAVETAHRGGVLHRDLKPANVLTSAFGKPGLTDFGIAAVVGEAASDDGGLSIPWSPPELFDDNVAADERSDVYSLGATVFTLLTGRSPFESATGSNSAIELMARIARQAPPSIGRDEAPAGLDRALAAAMAKSAEARPPSAAAFARMLQSVERDMRLQPTELDLPDVANSAATEVVTSWAEEDGTRRRSATVIALDAAPRQVRAPLMAGPPPLAPESQPDDATAFRRRVLDSGDRTTARPVSVASAPGHARPASDPPKTRRRRLLLVSVGIPLLAAVLVGVVLASSRGDTARSVQPTAPVDSVVDENSLGPLPPVDPKLQVDGADIVVTWRAPVNATGSEKYEVRPDPGVTVLTANPGELQLTLVSQKLPVCVSIATVAAGFPPSSPTEQVCTT